MSSPTASTPTYLDKLPDEVLVIIADYVIEANIPCPFESHDDCIRGLHNAWPESRYEALTKPYMHYGICFNGSAFSLKQIMDGFLLHPETRLWARVLNFRYKKSLVHKQNPFKSIKQEFGWMVEACTKLGLKVEGMELPVISRDGMAKEICSGLESDSTWPYKRLEFLAQVLHKVTKFCYYTDADWIWPVPIASTGPASRIITTPVPSALRTVEQYCLGQHLAGYVESNTYQTLLPAFFLPNIRVIQCLNIISPSDYECLPHLGPDAPRPHTSPVTTLHITWSLIRRETLEKFLRLPKALVEYSYRNSADIGNNPCTMRDMGLLLSKYHSKSLEILTLNGTVTNEIRATPRSTVEGHSIAPERIGSLRHFVKLRVIEAPYWSLVRFSGREIPNLPDYETPSLLQLLPKSLQIIKLSVDECQEEWLTYIKAQLRCMIQKKREMYPRLTKVEVDIRYIAGKERPDWDCLYQSFMDCLADLAMKQKVHFSIRCVDPDDEEWHGM